MKSRKLISFLGAAAMTASAFSGLTLTAFAEDTVLYSNSFDGYEKDTMVAFARTAADLTNNSGWKGQIDAGNEPFYSLYTNNIQSMYRMDNEDGNSITVQCGTSNLDDTSVVYIREKEDGDNYLSMPRARFSNKNGEMKLTGFDSYAANSGEDLLVSFKLMMTGGEKTDGSAYVPAIAIGDIGTLTIDDTNIAADTWYDVRVVIPAEGDAAVYVGESQVLSKTDGSIANGFIMENNSADTKSNVYPTVNFDELVIMSVAAGTASTVTVPEAEDVVDNSGEEPEATPAATIEAETTFDFETDDTSITVSKDDGAGRLTTSVVDDNTGNGTKVMQIASTADNSDRFGYATLDLSAYTTGKSHVIVEYDAYIPNTGRMTFVLSDGAPTAYSDSGLFRQGIPKELENIITDTWVHTVVDVDLIAGTGTFTVTGSDDSVISGNIMTDKQQITTLSFISWSPNTSYIDNIVIQTGGSMEVTTPPPAATITPEPASEVAGSGLNLVPTDAAETIATFAPAETAEVLNHAAAGVAVTTGATDINAYSSSARGYSIYAIYDVNVGVNSTFALTPYGNNGASQASTMQLVSDATGTVTVSAVTSSGTVAAEETLAHGTWYRVLVEVPQAGTSDATTTGNLTYTVYRIDPANPQNVSEIAAQLTDLSSRGLATRGLGSFGYAVTGTAYVDNFATFRAAGGLDITPEAETTPEPASTEPGSDITIMPEGAESLGTVAAGSEEVLNHTTATAVTTEGTTIPAYNADVTVRGYSVYAAFDAYVDKGTSLSITPAGNDSVGPTITLAANELGKVTLSAVVGSGENDVVTADDTLAAGTWYRVLVEAPQEAVTDGTGATTGTQTGSVNVTVYRINTADPSEVTEAAAQLTGLSARGLATRALTAFNVTASAADEETPSAYIDNATAFKANNAITLIPEKWYAYNAEYDENGILTNVTVEEVEDPSTVEKNDTETTKTFVWNNNMTPYVAEEVTE